MEPFITPASFSHISRKLRSKNAVAAVVLVGFVGGVYAWTYNKMRTNELTDIATELDEIRKEKMAINEKIAAPVGAADTSSSGKPTR